MLYNLSFLDTLMHIHMDQNKVEFTIGQLWLTETKVETSLKSGETSDFPTFSYVMRTTTKRYSKKEGMLPLC